MSNIPIAVPMAIVSANPMLNAASFGCTDIEFRSFFLLTFSKHDDRYIVFRVLSAAVMIFLEVYRIGL